ncbi:MAG: VanZ family protein [Ruminococcaceae bacterium]|nr:VanZ family protein [Oscillospiraceae bacterium]
MQKYLKCILTVLVLVWCVVIWQFSFDPASTSSNTSSQVQDFCNEVLDRVGVDFDVTSKMIRKTAHFLEFFVLGVLAAGCLLAHGFRHWHLLAPLVFVPVAVIDECIQIFVPGRGPHILDVLLDCTGGVCGTAAVFAVFSLILYIKNKRMEKNQKTS